MGRSAHEGLAVATATLPSSGGGTQESTSGPHPVAALLVVDSKRECLKAQGPPDEAQGCFMSIECPSQGNVAAGFTFHVMLPFFHCPHDKAMTFTCPLIDCTRTLPKPISLVSQWSWNPRKGLGWANNGGDLSKCLSCSKVAWHYSGNNQGTPFFLQVVCRATMSSNLWINLWSPRPSPRISAHFSSLWELDRWW